MPSIKVGPINLDLEFQSLASYGHGLLTCKSSRSAVRWLIPKIQWKQTDGDDCTICLAYSVRKNNMLHNVSFVYVVK